MSTNSELKKGVVRWFSPSRGYGFIDSKQGDVFVHYSAISTKGYRELQSGDVVQYTSQPTEKGLMALTVFPAPSRKASSAKYSRRRQWRRKNA
jgi:CspA family cold shock protein